jgi:predicted ribosome quality control (RQC) complex YloA/Tae2 family protein
MDPIKKAEYNRRAYEKRKAKLVPTLPSEEIKTELQQSMQPNDNNDKYYNKYKEMKKENELLKQELMELRIETKYLKQQLQHQPIQQTIQPIVQVLPQPKTIKNKTKIDEFKNAIPINKFFN